MSIFDSSIIVYWVAEKFVFSLLNSFPLTIGLKKETIALSIGLEV